MSDNPDEPFSTESPDGIHRRQSISQRPSRPGSQSNIPRISDESRPRMSQDVSRVSISGRRLSSFHRPEYDMRFETLRRGSTRPQMLFDTVEDDRGAAGDVLGMPAGGEEYVPPATRFQVDCTDALMYIDQALAQVAQREMADSLMANVYMGLAESVNSLTSNLRAAGDDSVVMHEIQQAKIRVYKQWMEVVRSQVKDSAPETAKAMHELEKAHFTLFGRDEVPVASLPPPSETILDDEKASASETEEVQVEGEMERRDEPLASAHQPPGRVRRVLGRIVSDLPGLFPPLKWLPEYPNMGPDPSLYNPPKGDRPALMRAIMATAKSDIMGGITTGLVMIPQGMAYAKLGGLPQVMGLYCGFIGTLFYAFFGTSRQLSCGPLALVSLMVNAATESYGAVTEEEKVPLAITLGFCVGITFLAMSVFRLGFLVNFLSLSVLSGFTSAAAVIIGASQLPKLFGLHVTFSKYPWMMIYLVVSHMNEAIPLAVVIGLTSLIVIIVLKKVSLVIPGALIMMIVMIAIAWPVDLYNNYHVDIVGYITPGLPPFTNPFYNAHTGAVTAVESMFPNAIVIAIVGYIEHISVAKMWARHFKYEGVEANQEMLALGLANLVGSFVNCYPMTGTVGRSAVAAAGGARSQFTSLLTSIVVAIVLLAATALFKFLPLAVLAAVVLSAVYSLVDYHIVGVLWRESRADLVPLSVTFFVTVILGVEWGIICAVLASLLVTMGKAARPNTSVLGRTPGTVVYRDIKKHKESTIVPGVIIFKFDGPIFFGNTQFLRDQLRVAEEVNKVHQPVDSNIRLNAIIFDAGAVSSVDYTALVELKDMIEEYIRRNILFTVANLDNVGLRAFQSGGLIKLLGADHFFWRVHDAVLAIQSRQISVSEVPLPPPVGPSFFAKCKARVSKCTCDKEGVYRCFPCLTRRHNFSLTRNTSEGSNLRASPPIESSIESSTPVGSN